MAYTPPANGSINFVMSDSYTPPVNGSIDFTMGEESVSTLNISVHDCSDTDDLMT